MNSYFKIVIGEIHVTKQMVDIHTGYHNISGILFYPINAALDNLRVTIADQQTITRSFDNK